MQMAKSEKEQRNSGEVSYPEQDNPYRRPLVDDSNVLRLIQSQIKRDSSAAQAKPPFIPGKRDQVSDGRFSSSLVILHRLSTSSSLRITTDRSFRYVSPCLHVSNQLLLFLFVTYCFFLHVSRPKHRRLRCVLDYHWPTRTNYSLFAY